MKIQPVPYNKCNACGQPLYAGDLFVSFCRSIEQFNYTKQCPLGEIVVADCYQLITLCVDCGNNFRVDRATAVLQAAVRQPQFARN